ncbi:MAG: sulfate permease [Verrucomicrobiota bacterium]|jgi:SulP family sulfate permease
MSQGPTTNPAPALARFAPGLLLLRDYRREWLWADLVAGISVCVVMIPSVIAYAGLLGLPPQYGCYAALVSLVVYWFFGSSRQVIVGPDIAISLLIAGAVGPLAGGDPARAAALAGALAVLSGLLLVFGAWAKIGAVADFFSKPVLIGYMTGAALILMASQLDKLLGLTLTHTDFFPRLAEIFGKLGETRPSTAVFGFSLLALLLGLRRFAPKIPPALVVCVVAIIASLALGLENRGVTVVGQLPRGLPAFDFPQIVWKDAHTLLPAAIGIALLTYTEGILLARSFAAKNGYEVNGNQELAALGLADIFNGFFQGFAITGSQARTAVNDAAGAKTQVAGLVAAVTLALFLLFLTPLIARLPIVALAAILVYGGSNLIEIADMKRLCRYYPRSAGVAAVTTLGVLAAGVLPGILVGVSLSLIGLIGRISHPPDAVLRELPGHGFHDVGDAATGQTIPGLVVYRFYAPLLFSNAGHFVERVRKLIADSPAPVVWFLLDAQAITDIDVTAAEAIHALHQELQARGIALKIAHANLPLLSILQRIGLASELQEDSFFSSVHECVTAFQSRSGNPPP